MKSKQTLILKIGLIVLIVGSVVAVCIGIYDKIIPTDKNGAEKLVDRDMVHLSKIVDFFVESDYKYIYISEEDCENGVMFTGAHTRDVEITDEDVLDSVKALLNRGGYNIIGRNGNTVYFESWSLNSRSRGIAFSLDKSATPYVDFIVESEPLSVNGWYYYRTDYEESRNG